jgi:hypothetical protein
MTYHAPVTTFTTIHGGYHWTYTPAEGETSEADFTSNKEYESSYRFRDGGNSPNWPHTKSNNSYVHHFSETRLRPLSFNFRNMHGGSATEIYAGTIPHPNLNNSPANDGRYLPTLTQAIESNREMLINKLLSRMSQQKVNVSQFIAERNQTANLVASTARRVAESMLSLRRGNIGAAITHLTGSKRSRKGIGRVAGGIPEQWLALQYGWKPLLSDVYGSCEELARLTTQVEPEVIHVSASVKTSLDFLNYPSGGDNDWFPAAKWQQESGEIHGNGHIYAGVGSSLVNGLSRTGLVNPVTLAWELLPWSFVVDWFLPVGPFLENSNAEDGLSFSRGWISQKISASWRASLAFSSYSNPGTGWSGTIGGGSHEAVIFSYRRTALTGFPVASWPSFKDPFSSTHVANALSLLATAFGRGPKVR